MENHDKGILKETKDLLNEINESDSTDRFENIAKTAAATNYVLFITIAWKSLDPTSHVPFMAKLAAVFFGLGIFFTALQIFAEYLSSSMKHLPQYRRLIVINEEHGDLIKEHAGENYFEFKAVVEFFSWLFRKYPEADLPSGVYRVAYTLFGMGALLFSIFLLSLGLFCLGIGIF